MQKKKEESPIVGLIIQPIILHPSVVLANHKRNQIQLLSGNLEDRFGLLLPKVNTILINFVGRKYMYE